MQTELIVFFILVGFIGLILLTSIIKERKLLSNQSKITTKKTLK